MFFGDMMVVNKLFFFLLTTTFLVGNAVAGNGEDNAHTSRVPAMRCAVVGSSVYEVTNNAEIIGAKALHAKGIRGQGTKAIVVDTYVDSTHEALIGRLSESTVAGNARIDSENASEAQRHQNRKHNQHGTHVTGIAAEIAPDATIKFIANSLNPVIALEDAAKNKWVKIGRTEKKIKFSRFRDKIRIFNGLERNLKKIMSIKY